MFYEDNIGQSTLHDIVWKSESYLSRLMSSVMYDDAVRFDNEVGDFGCVLQ